MPHPHSRIAGTGRYLPAEPLTNDDLVRRGVETSDEWVRTRTGIAQRHVAAEGESTSDLALAASREALAAAGLAAADVDLIIVATTTPDMVFPSTACILQDKLGVRGGPAFDVQAVCSGFVYALAIADGMLKTGAARNALVVGAEIYSRILDWRDRKTCVLFGDGAGAVVLVPSDRPGVLATRLHADGSHRGMLCVPGQVRNGAVWGDPFVHMDGQAVFKFAVRKTEEICRRILAKNGLTADDVDLFISHQANRRIIMSATERLGIPASKVVINIESYGNTTAATIPIGLSESWADGRIKEGTRILMAAFGSGYTWAGAVMKW